MLDDWNGSMWTNKTTSPPIISTKPTWEIHSKDHESEEVSHVNESKSAVVDGSPPVHLRHARQMHDVVGSVTDQVAHEQHRHGKHAPELVVPLVDLSEMIANI